MLHEINSRIRQRKDTEINWELNNPILLDGEIAIVSMSSGENKIKIGDGKTPYKLLPFFLSSNSVESDNSSFFESSPFILKWNGIPTNEKLVPLTGTTMYRISDAQPDPNDLKNAELLITTVEAGSRQFNNIKTQFEDGCLYLIVDDPDYGSGSAAVIAYEGNIYGAAPGVYCVNFLDVSESLGMTITHVIVGWWESKISKKYLSDALYFGNRAHSLTFDCTALGEPIDFYSDPVYCISKDIQNFKNIQVAIVTVTTETDTQNFNVSRTDVLGVSAFTIDDFEGSESQGFLLVIPTNSIFSDIPVGVYCVDPIMLFGDAVTSISIEWLNTDSINTKYLPEALQFGKDNFSVELNKDTIGMYPYISDFGALKISDSTPSEIENAEMLLQIADVKFNFSLISEYVSEANITTLSLDPAEPDSAVAAIVYGKNILGVEPGVYILNIGAFMPVSLESAEDIDFNITISWTQTNKINTNYLPFGIAEYDTIAMDESEKEIRIEGWLNGESADDGSGFVSELYKTSAKTPNPDKSISKVSATYSTTDGVFTVIFDKNGGVFNDSFLRRLTDNLYILLILEQSTDDFFAALNTASAAILSLAPATISIEQFLRSILTMFYTNEELIERGIDIDKLFDSSETSGMKFVVPVAGLYLPKFDLIAEKLGIGRLNDIAVTYTTVKKIDPELLPDNFEGNVTMNDVKSYIDQRLEEIENGSY